MKEWFERRTGSAYHAQDAEEGAVAGAWRILDRQGSINLSRAATRRDEEH